MKTADNARSNQVGPFDPQTFYVCEARKGWALAPSSRLQRAESCGYLPPKLLYDDLSSAKTRFLFAEYKNPSQPFLCCCIPILQSNLDFIPMGYALVYFYGNLVILQSICNSRDDHIAGSIVESVVIVIHVFLVSLKRDSSQIVFFLLQLVVKLKEVRNLETFAR